jgi:hypothetical protein
MKERKRKMTRMMIGWTIERYEKTIKEHGTKELVINCIKGKNYEIILPLTFVRSCASGNIINGGS